MSWQQIEGHDGIARMFSRAFFRKRLEGSFLFTGPAGVGKCSFAFALAKTILCLETARLEGMASFPDDFDKFVPCGKCESCRLFDLRYEALKEEIVRNRAIARRRAVNVMKASEENVSGPKEFTIPNHPDFYYVSKADDKTQIPLELLIGAKEERSRSGLCYDLSRTPFLGTRKVAVIDDADDLNTEGANALLKTLEEPPKRSVLILIGTSAAKQLPTIRSRCQSVRFAPLATIDLAKILLADGEVASLEEGIRRAKFAGGSFKRAKEFGDPSLEVFRVELLKELSKPFSNFIDFSAKTMAFLEEVGKESQIRRSRLAIALSWAADFYRDLARLLAGDDAFLSGNHAAGPFLKKAAENHPGEEGILWAAAAAERTVQAMAQIDRMVNVPYIVEAWLADLKSPTLKFRVED